MALAEENERNNCVVFSIIFRICLIDEVVQYRIPDEDYIVCILSLNLELCHPESPD